MNPRHLVEPESSEYQSTEVRCLTENWYRQLNVVGKPNSLFDYGKLEMPSGATEGRRGGAGVGRRMDDILSGGTIPSLKPDRELFRSCRQLPEKT